MKPKTPGPLFEDNEADRLIADFGVKPSAEKRQEIRTMLNQQKEKFLAQERKRQDQARDQSGRTL